MKSGDRVRHIQDSSSYGTLVKDRSFTGWVVDWDEGNWGWYDPRYHVKINGLEEMLRMSFGD